MPAGCWLPTPYSLHCLLAPYYLQPTLPAPTAYTACSPSPPSSIGVGVGAGVGGDERLARVRIAGGSHSWNFHGEH